jgi:hypothetical protein
MKKLIALILSIVVCLSFAACSKKAEPVDNNDDEIISDSSLVSDGANEENNEEDIKDEPSKNEPSKDEPLKNEGIKENNKENNKTEKPQENSPVKPEEKPSAPTESKPEAPKTVGNIILADFKAKAASMSGALSIAEALSTNSVVPYSLAAMEIEPGLLQGFDNAEIKGFKEGAVFMPMIGTHPFIGYVFVLENGADTQSFISNLKSNANLRWNICTTADEMVAGSVGNKVFFVMCPSSFEQE